MQRSYGCAREGIASVRREKRVTEVDATTTLRRPCHIRPPVGQMECLLWVESGHSLAYAHRVHRLILSVALMWLASMPAAATVTGHSTCAAPTSNEWLRQGSSSGPVEELPASQVRPVAQHLDEAIEKLETRSALLLSDAEARRFSGVENGTSSRPKLRPYLVRAVYPTGNPMLSVRWNGQRLDVFAGGLGCAPFAKHPIIVFLESPPREVFVMASAAL